MLGARSHPVLAQHLHQSPSSPLQCSGGLSSILLPAVSSWLVFPRVQETGKVRLGRREACSAPDVKFDVL